MSIQWYPGHMTKARREIGEAVASSDVVIEVLDARMPLASSNPVLTKLRRHKPCIKLLHKSDLADPRATDAWLAALTEDAAGPRMRDANGLEAGKVVALATTTTHASELRQRIAALAAQLAPHRAGPGKGVRLMIVGIPNVGKSTVVNTLMNRKVAKTGDAPAVTKQPQRVQLENGMSLSDHPGILWPKIEDPEGALRLALGGAIPDTAIDLETVALFGCAYLRKRYPQLLVGRYKLTTLPAEPDALLDAIGRKRGALRSGGVVDRHKAADVLIHDFRSGAFGRVSLEEPGD